jgi:predicted RNA-binding Zn ribbon-like protein
MNTVSVDRDGMYDALATNTDVTAWLRAVANRVSAEAGTPVDALDDDVVRPFAARVRELRDALRRLAAETTDDPRPPATAAKLTRQDALTTVNALAQVRPELVWPTDGQPSRRFRTPGTVVELAVGLIASQGIELFAADRRKRLRACLAPNCLLFFVREHSRREWCSAACGNRARVTRHYQRRHTTTSL